MKLKNDKRSHLKPDVVYGRKGEEVKMISDNGTVLIVEAESGSRFTVRKEEVTENEVAQTEKTANNIIKPDVVSKPSKAGKPGSQNQTTLF